MVAVLMYNDAGEWLLLLIAAIERAEVSGSNVTNAAVRRSKGHQGFASTFD
jgi:hypothetical protein